MLVAGITVAKAFVGWLGRQPWNRLDDRLGMGLSLAVHIQVLIGLVIWIGRGWAGMIPQAVTNSALRFIAIEHPLLMLIGLAFAHVGQWLSRKGESSLARHRSAAILYLWSLAVILAAVPWSRSFS